MTKKTKRRKIGQKLFEPDITNCQCKDALKNKKEEERKKKRKKERKTDRKKERTCISKQKERDKANKNQKNRRHRSRLVLGSRPPYHHHWQNVSEISAFFLVVIYHASRPDPRGAPPKPPRGAALCGRDARELPQHKQKTQTKMKNE
jgi:hypothetical protein